MVGMQQFNLRWNNHTSNILQVFLEHLSSESLVDVTLSCQGRFIKAHKIILSACSPYFQEVFANHTDKHPIIILKGITYDDLESIIKFMYNGEIRVQESELDELLAAAETLQVKGLSNVRSKYEKGEITSLNSIQKLPPLKVVDSASTVAATAAATLVAKKELPVHAIKTAVALFAPTTTTTRGQNTITTALPVTTAASTISTRAINNSSYRAITTVPRVSGAAFRATNIANRATANVSQGLTIATLMPSHLIPISAPASIRGSLSTISRSVPSVISTTISPKLSNVTTLNSTTTNTVSMILSPTMSASIIPNDCSTITIDPTSITSGANVHFDDSDDNTNDITPVTDFKGFNTSIIDESIKNDSSSTIRTKANTIMNDKKLPGPNSVTTTTMTTTTATTTATPTATTTKNVQETEKKSVEIEPPRVRKRRKMSHTVNELAKETVFASNGTVLLEPDGAVLKCMEKGKKISETNTENSAISEVKETFGGNEVKKLRVYAPKRPQASLLIKEKETDKNPDKIPRPPNAFMIFANEWRRRLAMKYPKEINTKISVRLGIMWKGLSIQGKETYYRLAKRADEEHKRKYPDYQYSPRQARMRKNLKDSITAKSQHSSAKGLDPQRMVKVYVNGEERQTDYYTDTDSSAYDYEDEEDYEDDAEKLMNYFADEDNSNKKCQETFKCEDGISSTTSNSSEKI